MSGLLTCFRGQSTTQRRVVVEETKEIRLRVPREEEGGEDNSGTVTMRSCQECARLRKGCWDKCVEAATPPLRPARVWIWDGLRSSCCAAQLRGGGSHHSRTPRRCNPQHDKRKRDSALHAGDIAHQNPPRAQCHTQTRVHYWVKARGRGARRAGARGDDSSVTRCPLQRVREGAGSNKQCPRRAKSKKQIKQRTRGAGSEPGPSVFPDCPTWRTWRSTPGTHTAARPCVCAHASSCR